MLLAAFVVVPIVEIAVFIEVGDRIGLWWTLGLVILTAIVGTSLLRSQGLATLSRAQASLQRNEAPVAEVFDGLCLLVAGALLLTPGFVTDSVGLVLFAPPVRAALMSWIWGALRRRGGIGIWRSGRGQFNSDVIDGDFHEIRPEPDEPDSNTPTPKLGKDGR